MEMLARMASMSDPLRIQTSCPVVSGTGRFAGAKGSLLIPIVDPGTRIVQNLYRLTYQPTA